MTLLLGKLVLTLFALSASGIVIGRLSKIDSDWFMVMLGLTIFLFLFFTPMWAISAIWSL